MNRPSTGATILLLALSIPARALDLPWEKEPVAPATTNAAPAEAVAEKSAATTAPTANGAELYESARRYEVGRGVKKDFKKALELYQQSADASYPRAYAAMARFYLNGWGCAKDPARAFELSTRGAELDMLEARCR